MFEVTKLKTKEKAILVGVKLPSVNRFSIEDSLRELVLLTETGGGVVLSWVAHSSELQSQSFPCQDAGEFVLQSFVLPEEKSDFSSADSDIPRGDVGIRTDVAI